MTESPQLAPKQRRAIEALLLTGEVAHAATAGGVNRDTIYRWLKQPAFQAAVREAEAQAIDEVSRVLIRLSKSAVGTLAAAMAERDAPIGPRIRAADITLSRQAGRAVPRRRSGDPGRNREDRAGIPPDGSGHL